MTAPAHRVLGYFWACSLALPVIREDDEALPVRQNVPTSQTSLGRALGVRKFALLFENDCRNLVNSE
jgi:hypothetical protein